VFDWLLTAAPSDRGSFPGLYVRVLVCALMFVEDASLLTRV